MKLTSWNGNLYHVLGDTIRCRADTDGCSVFEVEGEIGPLRIFAHDRKEAEFTYLLEVQNDPRWCVACESLNCSC
jgi:hypothetical protein